ncbi:MAG: hypothetical protein ACRDX8_05090 [Acidimicrobiales bacterium]
MVFNRAYLSGGQANIVITPQDPSQGIAPRPGAAGTTPPVPKVRAQPQSLRLPAVLDSAQAASAFPMVLVSPATARRIGVPTFLSGIVLSPAHLPGPPPSRAEQGAAKTALERIGLPVYSLYVERGFQSQVGSILLLLLGMASVVTFGATAVATGLAAADSRGDLGVLAAVGASPRVRRTL